jgi:hypothetical protein
VLEEVLAQVLNLKVTISKVSGSVVAKFSAGVIDSEGGAASDDKIFEDDASGVGGVGA